MVGTSTNVDEEKGKTKRRKLSPHSTHKRKKLENVRERKKFKNPLEVFKKKKKGRGGRGDKGWTDVAKRNEASAQKQDCDKQTTLKTLAGFWCHRPVYMEMPSRRELGGMETLGFLGKKKKGKGQGTARPFDKHSGGKCLKHARKKRGGDHKNVNVDQSKKAK